MPYLHRRALPATLIIAMAAVIAVLLASAYLAATARAASFPPQTQQAVSYASSTVYALSAGTDKRIMATSTYLAAVGNTPQTSGRTAVTLQTVNCAAGGAFIAFNDVAATTNSGILVAASSTVTLGDVAPMVYGSIHAISGSSCTLLVTEFRSPF